MKILHISDLHLTDKMKIEYSLKNLIKELKGIEFDVCICTGDLKNFDSGWDKPLYFINELIDNVSIDNLIIVPGNHDLQSIGEFNVFNKSNGECNIFNRQYDAENVLKQYNQFESNFVDKINKRKNINIISPGISHRMIEINGINFVLINSVHAYNNDNVNGSEMPFCCNCHALKELIENKKLSSKNSIAISHVPFDEKRFCIEDYNYSNQHITINELRKCFYCCIAGHKHTLKDDFYKVVGANSYNDKNFNVAIYHLDINNRQINGFEKVDIVRDPKRNHNYFNIVVSDKLLTEMFNLSKISLKDKILGHEISGESDDILSNSCINKYYLKISNNEFKKKDLITVFNSICELKQLECGKVIKKKKFGIKDNVFDEIKKILLNCEIKENQINNKLFVPLTIKGRLGTGKSTFMRLLYWHMLLDQKNKFDYIPVYINLLEITQEELVTLLTVVKKYIELLGKPAYILLDSLDNCKVCDSITDMLLNDILIMENTNSKFIFCVNQHHKSFLNNKMNERRNPYEFIKWNKTSEYLLYLRPISYIEKFFHFSKIEQGLFVKKGITNSNGQRCKDFLSNFIDAFFNLYGCQTQQKRDKLIELITNNEKLLLDFNLLYNFTKGRVNYSSKAYDTLESIYFNSHNKKQIIDATNKYLMGKSCLTKKEFILLKSQNVINMAFVNNLVELLLDQQNIENSIVYPVKNPPIPTKYFNTLLNGFVKLRLESINNRDILINNISNAIRNQIKLVPSLKNASLNYVTIAQLIYILRHLNADDHTLQDLSNIIKNNIKNKKNIPDQKVAMRTLGITKIYACQNSAFNYIQQELIYNEDKLDFNRRFTLFYYGDIEVINEDLQDNYQYYNSFCALYYRIYKNIYSNKIKMQKDLEMDLFTLCNIVQVGVQNFINLKCKKPGVQCHIFNTIALTYALINQYLANQKANNINEKTCLVYNYFKSVKNDFGYLLVNYYENIKNNNRSNHIINENDYEFYKKLKAIPFGQERDYLKLFVKLNEIANMPRSGWAKDIELNNERHESVAEHTFALLLNSLFFKSPIAKKNEEKIRTLLLLHDLAEVYYGDSTPSEEEYELKQDLVKATSLAFCYLGTYQGYSDWTKYAKLMACYCYPQENNLADLKDIVKIVNNLDKLQCGLKLVLYGNKIKIKLERLNSFYKEINELEVYEDNMLMELKAFIISGLEEIKIK